MNYDIGLNAIPSLDNDIAFGLSKQPLVVEDLTKIFNESIFETKYKFCRYDAYSNTTEYKIKSRRCRHKTFATTTVPVHKVQDVTEKIGFCISFYRWFVLYC